MSAVIRSLKGEPIGARPADPLLVETLEDLLMRAKSGSLHSLYSVGFDNEGRLIKTVVHNEWNPYQVVGAIEALKTRIMQERDL
jgi:xanthine dehydrogenase molybdopterin-binding subunit B